MAEHERQMLEAPLGMTTVSDISQIPTSRARLLKGFLPGRYGKLRPAPAPKLITDNFTATGRIFGLFFWRSAVSTIASRLLCVIGNNLYSHSLPTLRTRMNNAEEAEEVWNYTDWVTSPTAFISVKTNFLQGNAIGNPVSGFQFGNELILLDSIGTAWRYYFDGTNHILYPLGMTNPTAGNPTAGGSGSPLITGTYSYIWTLVDELGRESSPTAAADESVTAGQTVSVPLPGYTTGQGVTYWNLYRRNPGGTEYFYHSQHAIATTSITDATADADITSNPIAPDAGENDAPAPATFGTVWNGRVILNNVNSVRQIQISNAGSPTQFASFSDPSANPEDGLRLIVPDSGGGEISGLSAFGPYAVVMTRTGIHILQGEDGQTFAISQVFQRGCIAHATVRRATVGGGATPQRNMVFFLSDDGPYSLSYLTAFQLDPIGIELADIWRGFAPKNDPSRPNDITGMQAGELALGGAYAFTIDNIYYLSVPGATYAFDMLTSGWSDTNWGVIKTATVVVSGTDWIGTPIPTVCFLSRGSFSSFSYALEYFKLDDKPTDTDHLFPELGERPLSNENTTALLITRPYDGEQLDPHGRTKKARTYKVWGTTRKKNGTQIGTLTLVTDRGIRKQFPIRIGLKAFEPGVLFEQRMPSQAIGRAIWFEEEYTDATIERSSSLLLYDSVGR